MRTPLCTFEPGDEKVVWYQFAFKTKDSLDTDENILVAGLG